MRASTSRIVTKFPRDLLIFSLSAFKNPPCIHICENACPFCFIKQIPKGMRRSLYVMDDDYRHSMLHGSFVTLTNLTEDDWQRIEEQRLGPMHVSVHATNPDLRSALVGNPKGALILEHLARLERAGIDYHAQFVLCPGVNDGPELERSLRDLEQCGPHLKSIAGVPVGLTRLLRCLFFSLPPM